MSVTVDEALRALACVARVSVNFNLRPTFVLVTADRVALPVTAFCVAGSQPRTVTSSTRAAPEKRAENRWSVVPHLSLMGALRVRLVKLRVVSSTHHSAPFRRANSSSVAWSESSCKKYVIFLPVILVFAVKLLRLAILLTISAAVISV